jgi:hypothetical protein
MRDAPSKYNKEGSIRLLGDRGDTRLCGTDGDLPRETVFLKACDAFRRQAAESGVIERLYRDCFQMLRSPEAKSSMRDEALARYMRGRLRQPWKPRYARRRAPEVTVLHRDTADA